MPNRWAASLVCSAQQQIHQCIMRETTCTQEQTACISAARPTRRMFRQCWMRMNTTMITTEDELTATVAQCGFASTSAVATPTWIWIPWTWGWKGATEPLARALAGEHYEGFIVAIQQGDFHI